MSELKNKWKKSYIKSLCRVDFFFFLSFQLHLVTIEQGVILKEKQVKQNTKRKTLSHQRELNPTKCSQCLNKDSGFFWRRYCSQLVTYLDGILQEAPESMPLIIQHTALSSLPGPWNTTPYTAALLEDPQICFVLWLIALS